MQWCLQITELVYLIATICGDEISEKLKEVAVDWALGEETLLLEMVRFDDHFHEIFVNHKEFSRAFLKYSENKWDLIRRFSLKGVHF